MKYATGEEDYDFLLLDLYKTLSRSLPTGGEGHKNQTYKCTIVWAVGPGGVGDVSYIQTGQEGGQDGKNFTYIRQDFIAIIVIYLTRLSRRHRGVGSVGVGE